jgi:RNA polymerase sigma-70 factor (ECF subfamily)
MEKVSNYQDNLIKIIPKLRKYAAFLIPWSIDQQEDLVQETLYKALKSEVHYIDMENSSLSAYVNVIMKFEFINRYRSKKREKIELQSYDHCDLESEFNIYNEFEKQDLYKAIDKLNPEYRDLLKCSLKGYKYRELAKALDVSIGTVKSHLFYSKKALIQKLTA